MAAHTKPAYISEAQMTPEEKLLHAIFGQESADVREPTSESAASPSIAVLQAAPQAENETVIRTYQNYKSLVDRVADAFGNVRNAATWLSSPNPEFDNQTPLEFARKRDYDVAVLESALIRMEHGVFA